MNRNSRIIFAKGIKMDREYKNIIDYDESSLLTLLRSQNHLVAEIPTCSFIRQNESIMADTTYNNAIQSNYIAFQNPDYSNKWFFAWIDEVTYISNKNVEIKYTIDEWSTWGSSITKKPCFVVREHVSDDTIGLHTVPENLDIGDVICEYQNDFLSSLNNYCYFAVESTYNIKQNKDFDGVAINSGNLFGSQLFLFRSDEPIGRISNFLSDINKSGKIESVRSLFILPKQLVEKIGVVSQTYTYDNVSNTYYELVQTFSAEVIAEEFVVPTSFRNLTIKNNKCYCYPYNYLLVSNNIGNNIIYKYEDFLQNDVGGNKIIDFDIEMALSIGASIRLVPKNYKNIVSNYDESISLSKFPTCGWSGDAFTNWLTQNAVNIGTSITSLIGGIALGFATGGFSTAAALGGMALSTATSAGNLIGGFRDAKLKPSIQGGSNMGDVNFSSNKNIFSLYAMRCKDEYMKIIDDYFTRFGYKINMNKIPEFNSRTNWNYIEIGSNESIGNGAIPSKSMDIINKICRNGVTIWHNHANIGNYSLNNTII